MNANFSTTLSLSRHHILSELVNQKEFPLAVEQLAQNINYLCSSQGLIISTSPDKPFLKDLRTLLGLGHEKLGRELPKVANTPLSQQNQQKQLVTFRPATATVTVSSGYTLWRCPSNISIFRQTLLSLPLGTMTTYQILYR